jgi:hypothetical protein
LPPTIAAAGIKASARVAQKLLTLSPQESLPRVKTDADWLVAFYLLKVAYAKKAGLYIIYRSEPNQISSRRVP